MPVNHAACAVKAAAADSLRQGAELLRSSGDRVGICEPALARLGDALDAMEKEATVELPVERRPVEPISGAAADLPPGRRVHQLARPDVPRPGAELRGVGDRRPTST